MEDQPLSFRVNAYLGAHEFSPESMARVRDALARFDWMVMLATNRALEALPLPDQPDPEQPLAKVLPFKHDRIAAIRPTDSSHPSTP